MLFSMILFNVLPSSLTEHEIINDLYQGVGYSSIIILVGSVILRFLLINLFPKYSDD